MTQPGPFERRILDRVPIEPISVTLLLSVDGTVRSMLRRRPTTVEVPVRIVDVSIAGAGIEGPTKPELPREINLGLRYADTDSIVVVRRSEKSATDGIRRYGIEFTRIAPALKVLLHSYLQDGRPGEEHWLHSI